MLGQAAGSSESDSPSNARIPPTRPPAAQGRGAADGAESEWSSDESITPESGHRTLYDRLMVTPQAPPEILHAAYRALARVYHPDVSPDSETLTMRWRDWPELPVITAKRRAVGLVKAPTTE